MRCRTFAAGVVFALWCAGRASAAPAVHFQLRLAPGQSDAVLTLGDPLDDTLTIEVWAEITDAPPEATARWFGVFPRVSQDHVITYEGDFLSTAFQFGCVFATNDNEPSSGDLSPSCIDLFGTPAGMGAPALWGTFTVRAVSLGDVSYSFAADDGAGNPWSVVLNTGGDPPLLTLDDSDCGDGSCNVTGSVDPLLAVISVVDEPQVARSADADYDGDVDVADYAFLQSCAASPLPLNSECLRVDLDYSGTVSGDDLALFTPVITGASPPKGDLDMDGDVDMIDFARFQICSERADEPDLVLWCKFADMNFDGGIDPLDMAEFVTALTGPGL